MKKKETRGRKTKLTPELTRRICEYLQQGVDQKTACNIAGIPYITYRLWKERGDKGEEPYAEFFAITSRARDEHKQKLIKIIHAASLGGLPRTADWRAASFLLERGWPLEFAPAYREQVTPPKAEEPKKVSVAFFLETNGKTIRELTAFPVSGDLSPAKAVQPDGEAVIAANHSRPIVGIGGKVKGWTTEPLGDDDSDDDDPELP